MKMYFALLVAGVQCGHWINLKIILTKKVFILKMRENQIDQMIFDE